MKTLIFDSSSIITLSLNGLIDILEPIRKYFKGRFLITPSVRQETVGTPLKIRRFELEGLRVSDLIKRGVLEMVQTLQLENETSRVMNLANNLFSAEGSQINLLHEGEASCLALAKTLKNDTLMVIDERTARMLCENPKNLQKLMERKLHMKIERSGEALKMLEAYSTVPIIRSSELAFVAYKKGLIKLPADAQTSIEALLYATKFKGNSISYEEIEEAKRIRI
jgi:predicted nucleic acid-binding protein